MCAFCDFMDRIDKAFKDIGSIQTALLNKNWRGISKIYETLDESTKEKVLPLLLASAYEIGRVNAVAELEERAHKALSRN